MTTGRKSLVLGGCLSIGIALVHVSFPILGPPAYRYFGGGGFATMAASGSPVPAIVSLVFAVLFAGCGLYAFAGAGLVPRLPLARTALVAIGAVYTLRGLFLPLEIRALLLMPGRVPPRLLVFSAVSLVTGLAYLVGVVREWRSLSAAIRPSGRTTGPPVGAAPSTPRS